MRATLVAGLLLVGLGVGVVQASRSGDGESLLSSWIRPQESPPESSVQPAPPEPERVPPSAESSAGGSVLSAGEVSVVDSDAPDPMVRYFDAEGSIRMVRGLDRVPPEHRANAVVVGRGNVNVVNVPAPTASAWRDWQPEANPNRRSVVLFSAPWCGACKRAKRYLDQRGVSYVDRDIDADPSAKQEVRRVLGRIAIPLLDVDGRYISGFRRDVYDRALGSG